MKKKKQSHPVRNVLATTAVILLIVGGLFLLRWMNGVHRYSDSSTTGNTSTNLLNGGLFAKSGKKIYFANPYDQHSLYSMDLDLTHCKKVYDDYVSHINAAGDYIFYTKRNDKKNKTKDALFAFNTTGLYRIRTNGHNLKQLYRYPTQTVNLLGNHLYYQHYDLEKGLQLFRVDIDGKKDTMLLDEGASPTAIADGIIYYTGMDSDHNIHSLSTNGGGLNNVICDGNFTGLSYADGYLYCMDMNSDYALCRLNLDGSDLRYLTQDRIATYNISNDGSTVYYQIDNGEDNGLYSLDIETGTQSLLLSGNFNYLHVIDDLLFFENYDGNSAYVMDMSTERIDTFQPETK